MAELDVNGLKQLAEEPFATFTPLEMADWANDVQRQWPAIIAALEDRERLRAVEMAARAYRTAWTRPGPQGSIQEIKATGEALDTALEGRDG